jgi:predicted AAA+ superfamily ATPase
MNLARRCKVVTIVGPRGSGKTTLAGILFPRHRYVNLEEPGVLEFARRRPAEFLRRYDGDLVIDEFRRAPELAEPMRAAMLSGRRSGRFILISSRRQIMASTAPQVRRPPSGFMGTAYLLPLSIRELEFQRIGFNRDECIYRGFMPGVFSSGASPKETYRNYRADYLERDVRRMMNIDSLAVFRRFMKLMAGRVGQLMSPYSFAEEMKVPPETLAWWMSVLEACFVIFRLPSYFEEFGRRLVTTPKFYFADVGLAASILGLENPRQVFRDPQVGNLFENMVIADAFKGRYNRGKSANLYYYRSRNGLEVDLVINTPQGAFPVEIKAGESFNSSFARNIVMFRRLSDKIRSGCVVYGGDEKVNEGEVAYMSFKEFGLIVDP